MKNRYIFGSQFGNQIHISLKHVKTKWRHPFGAWPHHSPNREKSQSMHLRIPSRGWLAFGWISIFQHKSLVCYWHAMSFFDILIGICDQTSPHLKIHSQLQDSAKPHRYWLQALHLQSIGAAGLPTCWGAVLDKFVSGLKLYSYSHNFILPVKYFVDYSDHMSMASPKGTEIDINIISQLPWSTIILCIKVLKNPIRLLREDSDRLQSLRAWVTKIRMVGACSFTQSSIQDFKDLRVILKVGGTPLSRSLYFPVFPWRSVFVQWMSPKLFWFGLFKLFFCDRIGGPLSIMNSTETSLEPKKLTKFAKVSLFCLAFG